MSYSEKYKEHIEYTFNAFCKLVLRNAAINALCRLSEQRRTVLLMYFFLGYTDTQIEQEYRHCRSTANYWKLAALKQLRKEWRKTKHEE